MSEIKVRELTKKYGDFEALKGISFDVKKGEILGFLGPNGAGKTTTMKILTCFMSANGGDMKVAGYDCYDDPLSVRRKIGYLPENNPLYSDMAVVEYLKYMAELHDVPKDKINGRIRQVAVDCGLIEKINESISALSKGFRQRVGLAATLIHDPEILILDEPTVGLDPNQIIEIRNLIKKLGKEKTVILCSHLLAEVELTCNRIVIINKGKIVAEGTPSELKNLTEGHANLKLTVRGDKDKVKEIINAISGIKEVKVSSAKEKDANVFELVTVKNRDVRGEITKAVFEKGEGEFDLLDIHKEDVSLEEIFNEVTKS